MPAFWYMYILKSIRDGRLYIGCTGDLERRLGDHAFGKNASTAGRRPLILLYFEGHLSRQDALRRERYFKTAKGKTTLKQMIRHGLEQIRQAGQE